MPKNLSNLDLSALEQRILGSDTLAGALGVGGKELAAAGQDIYRAYAAKMFDVHPRLVTEKQRRYAKTVAYSKIYALHPPAPKDQQHGHRQEDRPTTGRKESGPRFQEIPRC